MKLQLTAVLAPIPPQRALFGLSGGRDSVALLHALFHAGHRELLVCHLDHALRCESGDDARFAASFAAQLGLEVIVAREEVGSRARQQRLSLETAARDARYEFFARIARERECPRLFLAHHADDQVETFLFNLLRGAGSGGLGGMRAESRREIAGLELIILRPWLGIWREEIDAYLAQHALSFREDSSNTDLQFARNRLRHEVLPLLERSFARNVRQSIWRTAEMLRAEDELLRGQTPTFADELEVAPVRALPEALQRRLLHGWLHARGVRELGFEHVESVRAMLSGGRAKVNLAAGWHARRRAGRLFIEKH